MLSRLGLNTTAWAQPLETPGILSMRSNFNFFQTTSLVPASFY